MLGPGSYIRGLWQCHVGGTGMVGLGFQVEECQMRYNVDKVATALQGAEDTSSYTVVAIDCFSSRIRKSFEFRAKGKQSKYIVFIV